MNAKVNKMIEDALKSDGIEEIFKIGEDEANSIDLFTEDFLEQIDKIKLPNTKIKVLQKLLAKAIDDFKKVNNDSVSFSKYVLIKLSLNKKLVKNISAFS